MQLCYFKQYAKDACRYRADGLPDRAHLVPQARIKKELRSLGWPANEIKDALWDKRLIVPACRHHHGLFDNKKLVLLSGDYPASLHEWANDFNFAFIDPRTGWVAVVEYTGGEAA